MTLVPLNLSDGSGGLNLRDPKSSLKKNQFAKLVNYLTDGGGYLTKRLGQTLLQYAPIDPQPFTLDSYTMGIWSLDEAIAPWADASANALDMNIYGTASRQTGLFPIGAGLGVQPNDTQDFGGDGSILVCNTSSSVMNEAEQATFEAWVKIPTSFTGRLVTLNRSGVDHTFPIHSGSAIVGFSTGWEFGAPGPFDAGITIHRDWDSVNSRDVSGPYFKFTLNTNGVTGTQTVIVGKEVPFNRWIHVKGTYNSLTGKMRLWVNGALHAEAIPVGGGTVYAPTRNVIMGGNFIYNYAMANSIYSTFPGIIDEPRISTVERTTFPFRKPFGRPMTLSKADGTRQLVVATDGGLYYTIGDQAWTLITATDPASGDVLSPIAFWDGVEISDRLYMTNGVNTPLTWDGTRLVPTGEAVAPPTLSLSAVGSTHTNGDFKYVYAYKYGDLDITGFSPAATITVSGNKDVNVADLLTRHPNCSAVQVYRTKAGGTQFFLLREITNDATATSLQMSGPFTSAGDPALDTGADGIPDGTTPTDLNDNVLYIEADAAVAATHFPKGQYYLAEHSRLFLAGVSDFPYYMYISNLGNPDVVPPSSFVAVPTDRGVIVALYSYYGEVHVSLNALATNVLRGEDPSNWSLTTNLHPKVGARDHWSVEHRYPVGDAGPYIIVIAGPDGLYQYAGNQMIKISDLLNPLFDGLGFRNVSKQTWLTSDQAQFQNAKNLGGSATQNVQADAYDTDGMRETPGQLKIVNQLKYIGLWQRSNPLVQGNIIAIAKGAAEGQFYFATDSDNKLYYTADNFKSVPSVIVGTPVLAGERIIQIVQRGTDDFWFLITDSVGTDYSIGSTVVCKSSGGGHVYTVNDPQGLTIGPVWQAGADTLYYDLDVPFRMKSSDKASTGDNWTYIGLGNTPNNLFVNHTQTTHILANVSGGSSNLSQIFWGNSPGVMPFATATPNAIPVIFGQDRAFPVTPNFFSMRSVVQFAFNGAGFDNMQFYVNYTRREFPRWRGGSFSPQAIWDGAKLLFLASSVEDANGNRLTEIKGMTSLLALTNYNVSSKNVSAIVALGTGLLFWTVEADATAGCVGRMNQSTLASPNTGVASAAIQANLLALRLCYNSVTATSSYIGAFKYFGTGTQEFWSYQGALKSIPTATSVPATLQDFVASGDSGPVPLELVSQTTTPYKFFAVIGNPTSVSGAVQSVTSDSATAAVFKFNPYTDLLSGNPVTGILSNLLFVPASGVNGGNLWADRLYWMAPAASQADARLLQLGVPGDWEVDGEFVSQQQELGAFKAFGQMGVDYSGNMAFFMRNAALASSLAANEVPQTPNKSVVGFPNPTAWAQFRATLKWIYSVAAPTVSPSLASVAVEYFGGSLTMARPGAFHWKGRTYFAFASEGSEENDVLVVYDKNNVFCLYEGWTIKGFARFKDMMVGLQDYELVQLEDGTTDLGALISAEAHTGTLASDPSNAIQEVWSNVEGSVSQFFPTSNGNIEIVPMAGDDELVAGTWAIPVPPSTKKELRRVAAKFVNAFSYAWGQAFSIAIRTSRQTGKYAPLVDQQESVAQLDLKITTATMGRPYTGK